jgi:hypothetical protein
LEVFMITVPAESQRIDFSREPDTADAMPRSVGALGICATCNYVDICTGRASWQGPVFHCEEFDDRVEMTQGEITMGDRAGQDTAAIRSAARIGLCVNCGHLQDCGFRAQEGGVWHCEEYE